MKYVVVNMGAYDDLAGVMNLMLTPTTFKEFTESHYSDPEDICEAESIEEAWKILVQDTTLTDYRCPMPDNWKIRDLIAYEYEEGHEGSMVIREDVPGCMSKLVFHRGKGKK